MMFIDDSRYSYLDPLTAVAAASAIGGTIGQIGDAKKRRETEQTLGYLDAFKREQLEKALQQQTSSAKRMEILANAVAQIRASQSSALIQAKAKKDLNRTIVIVGGSLVLILSLFLIIRK